MTGAGAQAPPVPPEPDPLAPEWEKELFHIISREEWAQLPRIAQAYPQAAPVAVVLDGLLHLGETDLAHTAGLLRWAWVYAGEVQDHEFVRKYISSSQVTINIAEGVSATLPMSRDAVGLALAEVEQTAGNPSAAIKVVEHLDPSHVAMVCLCELYSTMGRYGDIIEVTKRIVNEDDPTALLLTFRAEAFHKQGQYSAALESLQEALKSAKRDSSIRHRAYLERAGVYIAEDKKRQARRDLERILAEDPNFEGIRGLVASLRG